MALIRNHPHWNEDPWDSIADQAALPLDVLDRENAFLSEQVDNGNVDNIADYFKNVTISEKKDETNLAGLAARVTAIDGPQGSLTELKRDYNQLDSRVGEAVVEVENLEGRVTELDKPSGRVDQAENKAEEAKEQVIDLSGVMDNVIKPGGIIDQKDSEVLRSTGQLIGQETEERKREITRVEEMIPDDKAIEERVKSYTNSSDFKTGVVKMVIDDGSGSLSKMIQDHAARAAQKITETTEYIEATRDLNERLAEAQQQENSPLWSLQREINESLAQVNAKQDDTLRIMWSALDKLGEYTTDFIFVDTSTSYQNQYFKTEVISKSKSEVRVTALGSWAGELFVSSGYVNPSRTLGDLPDTVPVYSRLQVTGGTRQMTIKAAGAAIFFLKVRKGSAKSIQHTIEGGEPTQQTWVKLWEWTSTVNAELTVQYKIEFPRVRSLDKYGIRVLIGNREVAIEGPKGLGGLFSLNGGFLEILKGVGTINKGEKMSFEIYMETVNYNNTFSSGSVGIFYVE